MVRRCRASPLSEWAGGCGGSIAVAFWQGLRRLLSGAAGGDSDRAGREPGFRKCWETDAAARGLVVAERRNLLFHAAATDPYGLLHLGRRRHRGVAFSSDP